MDGRDELAVFLDRRPPAATQLVVERFRRDPFTLAKVGELVVGSFLGGEGDGGHAEQGRRFLWLDDAGRTLDSLEVHPVEEGFSRLAWPAVFRSALQHGVAVVSRFLPYGLIEGDGAPVIAERWKAGSLERLPTTSDEAKAKPRFRCVESAEALQITRRTPPNPLWAVGVILIGFVSWPLLLAGWVLGAVSVKSLLRQSFVGERATIELRLDGDRLVCVTRQPDGSRAEAEVALPEVLAVSLGPSAHEGEERDVGALCLVTQRDVVRVPHLLDTCTSGAEHRQVATALERWLSARLAGARSSARR